MSMGAADINSMELSQEIEAYLLRYVGRPNTPEVREAIVLDVCQVFGRRLDILNRVAELSMDGSDETMIRIH